MKYTVVTGAAGFIGSNLARRLNERGNTELILVDKFDVPAKQQNLAGIQCALQVDRDEFIEWLTINSSSVAFVYHLGARTNTTEFNFRILDSLNLSYSKALWEVCTIKQIPLVYASSAATYGMGELGFDDEHSLIPRLKPLNPYGLSKQLFDMFVLQQTDTPPLWAGLKFFNVYGPHEEHKGRMASVVYHAYNQIKQTGRVKLFKSHKLAYKDGEQLRDFVYVDDVVDICLFFAGAVANNNGIYNVGTGKAATFNQLVTALFTALNLPTAIDYVDIPLDIRDKYQYFTEAKMDKLFRAGYAKTLLSVEKGVEKYAAYLKNG